MKAFTLSTVALIAAGCGGQALRAAEEAAVRDYVETANLEAADRMRTYRNDSWSYVSDLFILYRTRDSSYLVEFTRPCYELRDNTQIRADRRYDPNNLRPRIDTIRGCVVEAIYPVNRGQAAELRNLGDAPGEGN